MNHCFQLFYQSINQEWNSKLTMSSNYPTIQKESKWRRHLWTEQNIVDNNFFFWNWSQLLINKASRHNKKQIFLVCICLCSTAPRGSPDVGAVPVDMGWGRMPCEGNGARDSCPRFGVDYPGSVWGALRGHHQPRIRPNYPHANAHHPHPSPHLALVLSGRRAVGILPAGKGMFKDVKLYLSVWILT